MFYFLHILVLLINIFYLILGDLLDTLIGELQSC